MGWTNADTCPHCGKFLRPDGTCPNCDIYRTKQTCNKCHGEKIITHMLGPDEECPKCRGSGVIYT